jgi:hypothetical protein
MSIDDRAQTDTQNETIADEEVDGYGGASGGVLRSSAFLGSGALLPAVPSLSIGEEIPQLRALPVGEEIPQTRFVPNSPK